MKCPELLCRIHKDFVANMWELRPLNEEEDVNFKCKTAWRAKCDLVRPRVGSLTPSALFLFVKRLMNAIEYSILPSFCLSN